MPSCRVKTPMEFIRHHTVHFFSYDEILARNPRFAAVNILLYLKDNEWFFPLIVRSTNERDRHSGQISLPGGKKEDFDPDFAQTAKRETSEEVGIQEHYIRIIREMSPMYIPPSNFYVKTFVSYTKKNPEFFFTGIRSCGTHRISRDFTPQSLR